MQGDESDLAQNFGALIRKRRVDMGVGLARMANELGVSSVYLSKVELGEFPPPARDRIVALAQALNCDARELLGCAGKAAEQSPRIHSGCSAELPSTFIGDVHRTEPAAPHGPRVMTVVNSRRFALPTAYVFRSLARIEAPDAEKICRALRRAVMALCGRQQPGAPLTTFFTGHMSDGSPSKGRGCIHLGYLFDAERHLLAVVPPYAMAHREPAADEIDNALLLEQALKNLSRVFAPPWGVFTVRPAQVTADDHLFGCGKSWRNLTPHVGRRSQTRDESVVADVSESCAEMGLPEPALVTVRRAPDTPSLDIRLQFSAEVSGPILIGRTRHFGGGLFRSVLC